jgi:hypothetical protein
MTASFGNTPQSPANLALLAVSEPAPVARPAAKQTYLKPLLKRHGRLRSVVGSDLKWAPRY